MSRRSLEALGLVRAVVLLPVAARTSDRSGAEQSPPSAASGTEQSPPRGERDLGVPRGGRVGPGALGRALVPDRRPWRTTAGGADGDRGELGRGLKTPARAENDDAD